MNKLTVMVILYLFTPGYHIMGQQLKLEIVRDDSPIGVINVEELRYQDSVAYVSESTLAFKFIWNYEWNSTVTSVMAGSTLKWSRFISYLNDSPRDDKYTHYSGNGYKCRNFDDEKNSINQTIRFTTLMMYFKEPVGVYTLYSERFQELVKLERLEEGSYKIEFPNGDVNHYYYNSKGELLKVDAFRRLFDLVFLPKRTG